LRLRLLPPVSLREPFFEAALRLRLLPPSNESLREPFLDPFLEAALRLRLLPPF
jgi:hypothetical protein